MKSVRRRRACLLWLLAILPLALLVFTLGPGPRPLREALLLVWVGAYAGATLCFVFCRCPACGGLFHSVFLWHFPFSSRCRSCGRDCRDGVDQSSRPIS